MLQFSQQPRGRSLKELQNSSSNRWGLHALLLSCTIVLLGTLSLPACGRVRPQAPCFSKNCPTGSTCNPSTGTCDSSTKCTRCTIPEDCFGGERCISGCCQKSTTFEPNSSDAGEWYENASLPQESHSDKMVSARPEESHRQVESSSSSEPTVNQETSNPATEPVTSLPDRPKPPERRSPPNHHCDKRFLSIPTKPRTGESWQITFRDTPGYVYIGLSIQGPAKPSTHFLGHQKLNGVHHWKYRIVGQHKGVYALSFTADKGKRKIAICKIEVLQGKQGPCTPNCKGVLCGGNDGCGGKCQGSHRTKHGGINDCRLNGDCGCGKEDNGNMVCGSNGKCIVRCSCDCLPPQSVAAKDLVGLNRADACKMLFKKSGDPTVWDYKRDVSLCPLDRDPQGADRCTKCPPCHRDHPTACPWKAWCTCRDPRWVSGYRKKCCANGHCF